MTLGDLRGALNLVTASLEETQTEQAMLRQRRGQKTGGPGPRKSEEAGRPLPGVLETLEL